MNDQNEAKNLLGELEGTIIADLRTCIKLAKEFPTGAKNPIRRSQFHIVSTVTCGLRSLRLLYHGGTETQRSCTMQ